MCICSADNNGGMFLKAAVGQIREKDDFSVPSMAVCVLHQTRRKPLCFPDRYFIDYDRR